MALTATEEALVRQILDQQAAILSLAGNEATITSKLGATKVTLADLVAASAVNDTDLFLARQGVTEKSVTGAVLKAQMNSFLQSGTGAVARTLQDKSRDVVSVKDFGAVGDGVTDDAPAIQAALDAHGALYFPAGEYLCGAKISSAGKSISIFGEGVDATRIIFNSAADSGFLLEFDSQGVSIPPDQLHLRDLTVESHAAMTAPAISAEWATYQPNAQGQAWISNINVTRKNDGTGSFAAGIRLNKCAVGFLSNIVVLGDDARVSAVGIDLIDCLGLRMSDLDVNRCATGIKVSKVSAAQTEGILIANSFVYDVFKGIAVDTAIHINIVDTHVNINGATATNSVEFVNVSQSFIGAGSLIYAGGLPGDALLQNCISISNCNGISVVGAMLNGTTEGNVANGIVISNSGYQLIEGNNISNCTTGIFVATGVSNSLIGNLLFSNALAAISDTATSTYRSGNISDAAGPLDSIRWGAAHGAFGTGEISANANWGAFIRGRSGTSADVALVDSANNVALTIMNKTARVSTFLKAALPPVATGGIICVSDETGGFTLAFSDGTNWRRVSDRAIVS